MTVTEPDESVNADVVESVPAVALRTRGTPASGLLKDTVNVRGGEPATKLVTDDGDHDTVVPVWTSYILKLGPL